MKNLLTLAAELELADIQGYFDSQSYQRGASYYRNGHVTNLRVIQDEGFIARVRGSESYITFAKIKSANSAPKLDCKCSCPIGSYCKHVVALLLSVGQALRAKTSIPNATITDDDFAELFGHKIQKTFNNPELISNIDDFLQEKTKDELIEMFLELAETYPQIKDTLAHATCIKLGNIECIVKEITKEIDTIMETPAWSHHWDDKAELADFSNVDRKLVTLLKEKQYDALFEIGEYFIENAVSYIEQCDDDGYAAIDISHCMKKVFQAIIYIDWTNEQKLLWAIDVLLNDNYMLFEDAGIILDNIEDKSAWSAAADTYLAKVTGMEPASWETGERNYQRTQFYEYIIRALKASNREEEILGFYKQEAKVNNVWNNYVEYLLELNRTSDARKAAEEGIKAIGQRYPSIKNSMKEIIANIAAKEGDMEPTISLAREKFVHDPSLSVYNHLLSSEKIEAKREKLRVWALTFLERGIIGDCIMEIQKNTYKNAASFPQYKVLLDIALHEKNGEQALKIFDIIKAQKDWSPKVYARSVAEAIENINPDRALSMYKAIIDDALKTANSGNYSQATDLLKRVRNLLRRHKRNSEWQTYYASILLANKRRPNFIAMAKSLNGAKLGDIEY